VDALSPDPGSLPCEQGGSSLIPLNKLVIINLKRKRELKEI
jgi:hypothetical protein